MDELNIISALIKIGFGVFVAVGFIKIFENYNLKIKKWYLD